VGKSFRSEQIENRRRNVISLDRPRVYQQKWLRMGFEPQIFTLNESTYKRKTNKLKSHLQTLWCQLSVKYEIAGNVSFWKFLYDLCATTFCHL